MHLHTDQEEKTTAVTALCCTRAGCDDICGFPERVQQLHLCQWHRAKLQVTVEQVSTCINGLYHQLFTFTDVQQWTMTTDRQKSSNPDVLSAPELSGVSWKNVTFTTEGSYVVDKWCSSVTFFWWKQGDEITRSVSIKVLTIAVHIGLLCVSLLITHTVCVCFGSDRVTSPHTQIICNLICDRLEKRRRITSQPMLLTSVLMRLWGRAAKTPFLPKLVFKQKLWGCRRTGRKDRKGIR